MSNQHQKKCSFANNCGHVPLLQRWDICSDNSESDCSEKAFQGQVSPASQCCLCTQPNHPVCSALFQQDLSLTPETVQVFLVRVALGCVGLVLCANCTQINS